MSEKKVLYLCDRKACDKCSYPDCKLTYDINHAKNFLKDELGNFQESDDIIVERLMKSLKEALGDCKNGSAQRIIF